MWRKLKKTPYFQITFMDYSRKLGAFEIIFTDFSRNLGAFYLSKTRVTKSWSFLLIENSWFQTMSLCKILMWTCFISPASFLTCTVTSFLTCTCTCKLIIIRNWIAGQYLQTDCEDFSVSTILRFMRWYQPALIIKVFVHMLSGAAYSDWRKAFLAAQASRK